MSHRLLCVDPDDEALAETVELLRRELSGPDLECETAGTLSAAIEALTRDTAAVITEYELPDGTGLDLLARAADACPDASRVLYTDADPDTIDTTALRGDVTEYVGKGSVFGTERLGRLVGTLLERRGGASYPVPQNETERLAALRAYDIDDPDLRASLDRITDLAARHFGVETASINLIHEHSQEFFACRGPAETWDSMDREDSICTFTILEDDGVMAVEDVTADPRFESRSEALVDLGIRSYLGANLVTNRGLVIGPLCVYDDEPRSFSAADETYLRTLAETAMELIELHAEADATDPTGANDE